MMRVPCIQNLLLSEKVSRWTKPGLRFPNFQFLLMILTPEKRVRNFYEDVRKK
jgi:hypothetical protein